MINTAICSLVTLSFGLNEEVSLSTCGGWRSVCLQVSSSRMHEHFGERVIFPSAQLSTDNADMVAVYAALLLQEGIVPGSCVTPDPTWNKDGVE